MLNRLWRWLLNNEALVLLLLLAVILRLPSLFEPYWYGDEGIYLVLGQAFNQGLIWYRDIHDNKPPLLYLLAAFTGTVFWFRLLLTVWFGATIVVFYRLMKRLLPQVPAAANLATLLLILLTTIFEGNIANAEIFFILPISAAVLLALGGKPSFLTIGFLFALAFLFKIPAAFDFLALLLWLIIWKKLAFKNLLLAGLSFALPIIGTIIYYADKGAMIPYVRSALLQNVGYLSSWEGSQNGLWIRLAVVSGFLVIFIPLAKKFKLSAAAGLAVIWFTWAMFGALLSERPYPHYLIQPAVPLTILLAFFVFGKKKLLKLVITAAVILAGLAYYQIRFWQYPIFGYYQNFIEFSLGKKSPDQYWNWFDPRVTQTYQLAKYIRTTTLPNEPIFIWGDEPYVYALSGRLPVGRYTVAYHVVDFNGFKETMTAWDKRQPKLVVVMTYETRPFPALSARLAADYALVTTLDQAKVYRRLNGATP
ncbi:hypothetical protein KKH13_01355 [Patescibacteria group bacterium]|nr:hypothetical protein [Patescibacteria group bacterium]